ncbi:DUF4411 family protein [Yersinia enterocolitica]
MTYLIDANVLIEAKNKYYHMDFLSRILGLDGSSSSDEYIASFILISSIIRVFSHNFSSY